ncbi:hypothetical protein DSCO28_24160 [Desulfosarcina ovata subsp. sediminis]|uniref:Uncharacterized protein n=1 Tax=Desulfosarcina ovata subsp. sediminis TaxID=885957 RepID=A0A5K7ZQG3_9BACT|nr:hypothetical protein [Desulfosarcina ovata]BBO81850.1 hypothetical protein DSCO28_24160 [Desulfosarcina ovata subsp. sediminis]
MISKNCSIEEFVKAVKEKEPQEIIYLANQEATKSDRIILKKRKKAKVEQYQNYSRQLKDLINYHRYAVKPRRKTKIIYNLYMKYWGQTEPAPTVLLLPKPVTKLEDIQKTA